MRTETTILPDWSWGREIQRGAKFVFSRITNLLDEDNEKARYKFMRKIKFTQTTRIDKHSFQLWRCMPPTRAFFYFFFYFNSTTLALVGHNHSQLTKSFPVTVFSNRHNLLRTDTKRKRENVFGITTFHYVSPFLWDNNKSKVLFTLDNFQDNPSPHILSV